MIISQNTKNDGYVCGVLKQDIKLNGNI